MVAIIDYDAGNIRSVEKAVSLLGEDVKVTRERGEILSADHIILPGVGAFGDAMEKLHSYGLTEVIEESVGEGIPFLGICLGLQLLFESSDSCFCGAGKCICLPVPSGKKFRGWAAYSPEFSGDQKRRKIRSKRNFGW